MHKAFQEYFYSFIIVAKDEENNLSRCLEGIRGIGVENGKYEVILVDNGSSDSTVRIAEREGARVFIKPSLKVSGMRNYGAMMADGNFFIFLDADVVIDSSWFFTLIEHLKSNDADCVFAPESWYESPTIIEKVWLNIKGRDDDSLRKVKWCQSGAFMIKRQVFESIGGFNENLETCEDYDFGVRLSEMYTILRDGTVCFRHLRTPKTVKELFWQQVWHGKDSFRAYFSQKFSLKECIGLFLPTVFILSLLFFFIFFFYSYSLSLFFLIVSFSIYLVYVKYKIKTMDKFFGVYLFVILIFIIARGLSPFIKGRRLS